MPVGTRMPSPMGRTRRLMAMAVAAACWLAVPAEASAQQDPALNVAGLTSAATGAVAATGAAAEDTVTAAAPLAGPAQDTVTQVTGSEGQVARVGARTADATESVVQRVTRTAAPVAGVADRVANEARRAVDETRPGASAVDDALQGATDRHRGVARDSGTTGAAAGRGLPRVERLSGPAAGGENLRASRLRLRGAGAAERPYEALPSEPLSPILTPLIPGPPIGVPGMPAGGGDTGSAAAAGSGALELPSDTAPVSGTAGGSSAAGASVSFSLGGLALLLATLSLAGPALRRRLPRRPVIGWPAAFVPLLERPG